ncbi:MAG: CoA transferase [Gammaproteobacteria bacterium]|nr:CoA transferase [Gammaproteobacteria bacterium]
MGPLHGLRILEIAGIGPTQLCGMLLADMGANIIRIERPADGELAPKIPEECNLMNRSRPGVLVDLKSAAGADLVLRLCDVADAVFEGFRPGVMEKLGLGPKACMARNERLVYGRMTGWGQDGPLAGVAGHDANYIALSGALGCIGDADRPPPLPLNLVGDFGGGALYLAMGLLAAMLEATRSGKGQVVDAAMVDGSASMMTMFYGLLAGGLWTDGRQRNLLDGAAPFARSYETLDGKYVAVCAIENRFFRELLEVMDVGDIDAAEQYRTERWASHAEALAAAFRSRTRDDWARVFNGKDACATPVLSLGEAPRHEHMMARQTFITVDGIEQPAPAPRFSRTGSRIRHGPAPSTVRARQALIDWGLDESEASALSANTYASPGMG